MVQQLPQAPPHGQPQKHFWRHTKSHAELHDARNHTQQQRTLILPSASDMVSIMFDEKKRSETEGGPLSPMMRLHDAYATFQMILKDN